MANDYAGENAGLLTAADASARKRDPVVENSKVLSRATLTALRRISNPVLAFISFDDIVARHNLSYPLRWSFPSWDVFFTSKTFNVAELKAMGVRNPVLVSNIFDPKLHRPMARAGKMARISSVSIWCLSARSKRSGARASMRSLRRACPSAVYGNNAGIMAGGWSRLDPRIERRSAVQGVDYARALHHGRICLGFLRKINRDRITTRSIEIPRCGAMIARQEN